MPYRKHQPERDADGNPVAHPPPRSSWAVELPIYAVLVLAPLAIGTVHLASVLGALLLSGLALAALLLATRRRRTPLKLFPLGLLLLGVLGFAGLQLVPLPPGLVGAVGPGAADVLERVLAGTELEGAWRPLSLAPQAGVLELLKLAAGLLVFVVVVNYFNDRHRARRLLKLLAWSGFVVALIGFFSKLFVATRILGFYPLANPATFFFSTFVNPNHLAGFLLLCAPVAVGLALSAHGRQDRALYGFMGVIMGVAVFMSLSRGGMVALVAGLGLLVIFAATRRARRLRHTALVQVAAAGVLVLAGYLAYDTILRELRTLGDLEAIGEEAKIQAWGAAGPMIADHPLAGIGRGAYAAVYPRYKSLAHQRTFTHAENQTLQYLVELGPLVGGLLVLGLLVCFGAGLWRAQQSYSMGGALAGVFGCLLHNQVDFNLETGAVLLACLALFGVLAASPFSHAASPSGWETRWRLPRPAAWGLLCGLGLVAAAAGPWAARHDPARLTEALLEVQDQPGPVEPCDQSRLGRAACALMARQPSDFLPPLLLGRANLRAEPPRLERAVRWLSAAMFLNPTDPTAHRLAGRALFLAGHREQALVEYRLAARWDRRLLETSVAEVLRLSNDPDAAIRATPEEPEALLATARILQRLGQPEAAGRSARRALDYDAGLLAALDLLADLALAAGRLDEARDLARRAVEIEPQHDRAWVLEAEVLVRQARPAEAEQLLRDAWAQVPDSTRIARRLVELYLAAGRTKEAEAAAARLQTFVAPDDRSQAQLLLLLGRIKEARELFFEARKLYRQAVELQPADLPLAYRLARTEERIGAWDEAERLYGELREQRFRPDEMDERLELVRRARQIERDRAMWNKLLEPGPGAE